MMKLREVLGRFSPYYRQYWRHFALGILGMFLSALGTAGSFQALQPILDYIFVQKRLDLLYIVPFFLVFAYFLKNLGAYMQTFYIAYVGTRVLKNLRERVLENLLRLDLTFFKKHKSGELISRSTNDIGALQSIVSNIIPDFLREAMTAVGLLAVVIYNSPKLALIALIALPCAILPLFYLARRLRIYAKRTQESNADLLAILNEIFSNIELIKLSSAEKRERDKFDLPNESLCKATLKNTRIDALISPMMEMIGALGVAVVILIGGREVIGGELSAGAFIAFIAALFGAYTPIKRLTSLYGRLQMAVVASERTFYLLDLEPEILGGPCELPPLSALEFRDVHFAYEGQSELLRGVNFCLKRGEILALVGESGGGKSSIIGLILHFFAKNAGEILLNGEGIENFSLKSLRSRIGLVTQNIYIFNESVAQNVAYGEDLSEERVLWALRAANAYDFVEKMGGIHTPLLENGKNLSGGQKQRIAIARALYKRPDLLIFDEATSALDNESERAIIQSIEALKKDRLILVVAHRLSTIENADKIAVMEGGRIVACGSDGELLQNCALYQKFKNKGRCDAKF